MLDVTRPLVLANSVTGTVIFTASSSSRVRSSISPRFGKRSTLTSRVRRASVNSTSSNSNRLPSNRSVAYSPVPIRRTCTGISSEGRQRASSDTCSPRSGSSLASSVVLRSIMRLSSSVRFRADWRSRISRSKTRENGSGEGGRLLASPIDTREGSRTPLASGENSNC